MFWYIIILICVFVPLGMTERLKSVTEDRLGVGLALWWFHGYPSGWWRLGSIYWIYCCRTGIICGSNQSISNIVKLLFVCEWALGDTVDGENEKQRSWPVGRQEGGNRQSDRQLHRWTVDLCRPLFVNQVARSNMIEHVQLFCNRFKPDDTGCPTLPSISGGFVWFVRIDCAFAWSLHI